MTSRIALAFSICALGGSAACAHREPVERATISTVGNEDATGNKADPDNKKMHYTKVNNEDALNHDDAHREHELMNGTINRGDDPTPALQANATTGSNTAACDLNVYFETASAELNDRSRQQLTSIAACLKRHEAKDALIVGSADPRGSESENDKLGKERARVVGQYLRELGVPASDIKIRSVGESQASNAPSTWPAERNAQVKPN
jgi:outer membrane protein OmpA-like peptidoglycan-associated protein